MVFTPESVSVDTPSSLQDICGAVWTPLFKHTCSFPPEIFREVIINLIRNPNINSNHLFRADISLDTPYNEDFVDESNIPARIVQFKDYQLKTVMVRTMIPRNPVVDKPLDQTCLLYEQVFHTGETRSLVIYLPHISAPSQSPFYHPAVHGIAFLHSYHPSTREAELSIEYSFFDFEPRTPLLERTAHHLLAALYKHGQGKASGYIKRVQHDVIIPQATVQNTYARLKLKYAKPMIDAWVEDTDPGKHVFEDLGIAAFLIELWAEMYQGKDFPGFADIGCGNGLLVHILLEEGYSGWGFDARRRKSWSIYSAKARENLKELVLVPSILRGEKSSPDASTAMHTSTNCTTESTSDETSTPHPSDDTQSISKDIEEMIIDTTQPAQARIGIHDGLFPKGTFIISNHADELTPWTPILANLSESPFMMIPCCSHSLGGARFRAPPPKGVGASTSTYASLVVWVSEIAQDCGWIVEKEMLRIPSTRNIALIGRARSKPFDDVDVKKLVEARGGAVGWEENAMKLVKGATRGH